MHRASLVNYPKFLGTTRPTKKGLTTSDKKAWVQLTSDDCELETADDGIRLEIGHDGRSVNQQAGLLS